MGESFWGTSVRSKCDLRAKLGLRSESLADGKPNHIVLVMGGGEGFGALCDVATAIGMMLAKLKCGQMVVVCGRNAEAREVLRQRDWDHASNRHRSLGSLTQFKPQIFGFVPNIDEYMGAADVLVTKAGPGTIAEATIRG